MMNRRALLAAGLAATGDLAFPRHVFAQTPSSLPTDEAMRRILSQRVTQDRQAVGLACVMLDGSSRRVLTYGAKAAGGAPISFDTLFEIGSLSKTFTSLLLADMVLGGEVRLDQPVAELLPVKLASRSGPPITLHHLATHSSGLPRMPPDFAPADFENPFADFTVENLYAFLSTYIPPRDPGARYEYSNVGAGLLGHVLALRAGKPYEALLKERITRPLGMYDTTIALTPAQRTRFATGHGWLLVPAANWDLPALSGAGAIRSTPADMQTYLSALLGLDDTSLKTAIDFQLKLRTPRNAVQESALAWGGVGTPFQHSGATGGYRAYITFDRLRHTGAVLMANTATSTGPNDIGKHLLESVPLQAFKPPPTLTALDPAKASAWASVYHEQGGERIVVTFEQGRLYALFGGAKSELLACGPISVAWKLFEATADFETNASGVTEALILHQGDRTVRLPRQA